MEIVNDHPPLTAETREQISICEYQVRKALSNSLVIFAAVSLPCSPALKIAPGPDPPRQPIRLFRLLKGYAVNLFNCENGRYPQTEEVSSWRDGLARRIEQLVMEDIRGFEKAFLSLRFHASLDEMMASVREGLTDHINKLRQVREFDAGADRTSGDNSKNKNKNKTDARFPDRAAWLNERLRERSWNKHDVSRQGGPHHKTVQKIRDGRHVREDLLEKLAKALSSAPFSRKLPAVNLLDIPQS